MKKCVLSILMAMSIVAVACAGESAKLQSETQVAEQNEHLSK